MTGYCKPFAPGVSWRSQNFGANPNNGTNGPGGHTGNDEACDIGSEVHAAGDGVIEYAGQFDNTYADNLLWLIDFGGNILVLNCGDTKPTFIYAHLSRFRVKAGDRVRKGQVIADSGNSGTRTTGPHCHVEAIPPGYVLNSPTLGRVNPDIYLTEDPPSAAIAPQSTTTKEATVAADVWEDKITEYKEDGKTPKGKAWKSAGFILGQFDQYVGRILKGQMAIRKDIADLRKALGK